VAGPTSPVDLQFHLAISSRYENIEIVQVVLNDSLERLGLDDDTRHWLDLAVREAVANAIKHGNEGDPDKRVEVALEYRPDEVVVRVEDEGHGFDPRQVDDPRAPENLLRPFGRGIFYIESFMDGVEWGRRAGGGTVVTLRKRIGPRAEEPPPPNSGSSSAAESA
jgi:serine/threonine-protein kinase RsbW